MSVCVLGGGIIGLATAFELADRGVEVTIFENRTGFGAGATAAAIGGITPQSEAYCRGPLRYVATWSTNMYPEFLNRVAKRGGRQVHVLNTGQLQVALSEREMNRIEKELIPVWTSEGFESVLLDRSATLVVEPSLGPQVVGSVLLPIETAIDPPELAESLIDALGSFPNVELVAEAAVIGVASTHTGAEVRFEDTASTVFETVVVAAGLGSTKLLPEVARGIYPMRGQGVEFRTHETDYPLVHHVYAANGGPRRSAYMVPRADGRVAAGVTYEPNVDSTEVDPDTIDQIVAGLVEVCPAVDQWERLRTWSGVRPASIDGIPFIGHVSDHIIVCAGHQGLGITLAPISGHLVAELVDKGRYELDQGELRALSICSPRRLLD